MPQFIRYKDDWYKFENHPKRGLIAVNFKGGWFDIDENSSAYLHSVVQEFADWHDLYRATGYDPTRRDISERDIWVSPFGTVHEGEAHSVAAEGIAEISYGWNDDDNPESAEFLLEQKGWIKCSKFFWNMHLEQYGYGGWLMTKSQANIVKRWCELHRIEYPEDIITVRFGVYNQ